VLEHRILSWAGVIKYFSVGVGFTDTATAAKVAQPVSAIVNASAPKPDRVLVGKTNPYRRFAVWDIKAGGLFSKKVVGQIYLNTTHQSLTKGDKVPKMRDVKFSGAIVAICPPRDEAHCGGFLDQKVWEPSSTNSF